MKNLNLKRVLALGLAAAMTLSLAACGGSNSTSSETQAAGDTAAETEAAADDSSEPFELTVQVGSEPGSLDPDTLSANDVFATLSHMWEGLTRVSADGWEWGQAESVDVSDDGITYTFHLRDDITWSDGEPVTAADFVYGWERLVAGGYDYSYYLDAVKNAVAIEKGEMDKTELGVEAVDDQTFVVTLEAPCAYFLDSLCLGVCVPIRQDIVEANGEEEWAMDPSTYVTNGAYTLVEWSNQEKIVIAKRADYYDADIVGPDQITFMLMDDDVAILSAYETGELDYAASCPTDESARMLESGDLHITDMAGTYYIMVNAEGDGAVEELQNYDIRRALSLVIDRNYICDVIKGTGEKPADTWVGTGFAKEDGGEYYDDSEKWWSNDSADYEANCEEARQILADAGYPDGEGFPVITYVTNTSTGHEAIAAYLQSVWSEELGITCNVETEEWAVFLDDRDQGNYCLARGGWTVDYLDPSSLMEMWITDGGNNDVSYSNSEYDELIAASKTEMDQAARFEMYHEAEAILAEELPIIPLYYYTDTYLMNEDNYDGYFSYNGMPCFIYVTEK